MSQLSVECFIKGLHAVDPVLCLVLLSALAADMACITALIYVHLLIFLLICHLLHFMFAFVFQYKSMIFSVCLFETMLTSSYLRLLLLISCSISCLSEENAVLSLYAYLLPLCVFVRIWKSICAHTYIYSSGAPYWTMYKMLIGCFNCAMLDMLVYTFPVLIV